MTGSIEIRERGSLLKHECGKRRVPEWQTQFSDLYRAKPARRGMGKTRRSGLCVIDPQYFQKELGELKGGDYTGLGLGERGERGLLYWFGQRALGSKPRVFENEKGMRKARNRNLHLQAMRSGKKKVLGGVGGREVSTRVIFDDPNRGVGVMSRGP